MRLLFASEEWDAAPWRERLEALDPSVTVETEPSEPAAIDYVLAWKPRAGLWPTLTGLKGVVNLGAGVDALLADPSLPDVPIARCVDPDLSARMAEYITLHCLAHLRDVRADDAAQARAEWEPRPARVASEVTVGLMGYGALARAAQAPLHALGFSCIGWSRSAKDDADVPVHVGADGLRAFLAGTDILVSLLPLTDATRGLLNASAFAKLRRTHGAPSLINAGRGGVQVEPDILAALDAGTLGFATLDVFEEEPLPADNPLWRHPRVRITPHVAAPSDPLALAPYVLAQIERMERGLAPEHPAVRDRGY